jgi:hypothetical protein
MMTCLSTLIFMLQRFHGVMKNTVYGAETINSDSTLKRLCKFSISAGLTLNILSKLAECVVNYYL